jgi:hypothetical protein
MRQFNVGKCKCPKNYTSTDGDKHFENENLATQREYPNFKLSQVTQ